MPKTRYTRWDASGTGDGTTPNVGGPHGAWTWAQFLANLPLAGDHYYIKGPGTYWLSSNLLFNSGTATTPTIIEGWTTTPGDHPRGTDRPGFICSSYRWRVGTQSLFRDLRIFTNHYLGCESLGPSSTVVNVRSVNSGPSYDYPIAFSGSGVWIDCSGWSTGTVWACSGAILGCFCGMPGSSRPIIGIDPWVACYIARNIIYGCDVGISLNGDDYATLIQDNTFYDCGSAVKFPDYVPATRAMCSMLGNIFDTNAVGVDWNVSAGRQLWLDHNNFSYNIADVVNCSKGGFDTAVDPGFFNVSIGDFRVGPAIKGQGFPKWRGFFGHVLGANLEGWADQGALHRGEVIGEAAAVQEIGPNARSGLSCVRLNPTSTTRPFAWSFLIPCDAGKALRCEFWYKVTAGFNGSLTFSAWGGGIVTIIDAAVALVDDGAYHVYDSAVMDPTSDGYITIILKAYDGVVSGSIFIDDIVTSN